MAVDPSDRRRLLGDMSPYRAAVVAAVALSLLVGFWNAWTLSPDLGYDAVQHQEYARVLVEERRLPEADPGTRALYDNPPGFYLVAGIADEIGERIGLDDPHSLVQYLNALFVTGGALLVFGLARIVWPDRRRLQLAALAFAALVPAVPKAAAMYHPGPLALLLAAASLYLAAGMIVRRDFHLGRAAALGGTLVAGVAVAVSSAWVYVAIGIGFLMALPPLTRDDRMRALRAMGAVALIALVLLVPIAWELHQRGRSIVGNVPIGFSTLTNRPVSYYTDLGLPDALSRPYRPSYAGILVPTAYSELWGDYFGAFSWNSAVVEQPPSSTGAELVAQNWIGLPPTALSFAGVFALLGIAVRGRTSPRAGALATAGALPAVALIALVAYAVATGSPDGDTIKATFALSSTPGWAIAFGFAVGTLARGRAARPLAALLVLILLANLRFVVAGSPLGGLL
jgi:hypothetical protein